MVVLALSIKGDTEPIEGVLSAPDGRRWAFQGYVALIGALERARAGEPAVGVADVDTTNTGETGS